MRALPKWWGLWIAAAAVLMFAAQAQAQTGNPAGGVGESAATGANSAAKRSARDGAKLKSPPTKLRAEQVPEPEATLGAFTPKAYIANVLFDQKALWTSPAHIRTVDAFWLAPLVGVGGALLATDSDVSRGLSNSPNRLNRFSQISNVGVGTLLGGGAGSYLLGLMTHNPHEQETGFLSMESLADALIVNNAVNFAAGRERPLIDNSRGRFWQNGRSFPSNHAVSAWSVASVIAHEYPGPLTKLLAYGLAAAVSASRVPAKQHFPTDVLVGSALGWLVGQEVYRAHHDPELGGTTWNSYAELHEDEAKNPANFGSPYVPLDSWVYPAMERLAAMGYVRSEMLGLRPWTRLECARLVQEAQDRMDAEGANPPPVAVSELDALAREFKADTDRLGGGSNRSAELDSLYQRTTYISGQPLTDGFDFGQTIYNDRGRPYEQGTNVIAGFTGWGTEGPFVGYIDGEFQHAPSAPPLPDAARAFISQNLLLPPMPPLATAGIDRFDPLEGYVGMAWGNWQITAGKQSLWWSPADGESMNLSDNAEPFEMLQITREVPFKLPSLLGLMGPIRVQFWVGQQSGANFLFGPTGLVGQWGQTLNPQPIVHGQKISFKPTPNLEFGFDRTTIYGGPGYPLTAHNFLRSLFSISDTIRGAPNKPGDRQSGFDMNYRLPLMRNWATFYVESFTDDEFSPIAYFDKSANLAGLYFARLPGLPKFDLRLEGAYTNSPVGGNEYQHGYYYSDLTWIYGKRNAGNLFTTWLGREGVGEQGWLTYWQSPQRSIQFQFRHQKVAADFVPDGGTINDGALKADWWFRKDLDVSAQVQYERWDFPVLAPGQQTDVTGSVQITFRPRWGVH